MFRPVHYPTGHLKHDAERVRSAVTQELLVFLLTSLNWIHWQDLETGNDRLLLTSLFLLRLLLSRRALWQWRCRQYVPPKNRWTSTRLYTYNSILCTYRIIHAFTRALQWSWSEGTWIKSTPSHCCLRSVLTMFCLTYTQIIVVVSTLQAFRSEICMHFSCN